MDYSTACKVFDCPFVLLMFTGFKGPFIKGRKGRINTFHSASENRAQSLRKSHLSLVELSSIIYMQWQELGQPFVGPGWGAGVVCRGGRGCLLSWFGVCSVGKKIELFSLPKPHL